MFDSLNIPSEFHRVGKNGEELMKGGWERREKALMGIPAPIHRSISLLCNLSITVFHRKLQQTRRSNQSDYKKILIKQCCSLKLQLKEKWFTESRGCVETSNVISDLCNFKVISDISSLFSPAETSHFVARLSAKT